MPIARCRLRSGPKLLALLAILAMPAMPGNAQEQQPPTFEELGANPPLFLQLMDQMLGWEEPVPAARIAGPLSFVGTKGQGVFLLETSDGLILINSGMQSSGPMIEASIRSLGLDPAEIRIILAGHGHVDHAGGHAYLQRLSGAEVAMMEPDAALLETGGKADFFYRGQPAFEYESVAVDRVLRDGDRVMLGDTSLLALLTPGHTRGATTFVFDVVDGGQTYRVVIPDGTGVNPGYRVLTCPTYPGIRQDYRTTYHRLELLDPDIWLPLHNEAGGLAEKIERSKADGAAAFVDPVGYELFIRKQRSAFEARIDAERAAPRICGKKE